jgi:hypothetical protein
MWSPLIAAPHIIVINGLMRYFKHIVTDNERIADREGQEYPDLESARSDASQGAREIMADELLAGRAVPLGWRVQIADPDGAIVMTISFVALVLGEDVSLVNGLRRSPAAKRPKVIEQAIPIRSTLQRAYNVVME